ncbi:hypothetical protein [Glycomyces harbinensis]|uniref:Secreted protein n=1 Tax=Glycomyces harbinensis TaxID=58114 RepID=A0A1G7A8L4_9ACTN|nr:hypothetical protein [Glycomyces harbinensis]SDE11169.1 hypothetical protein SAMN05216270_1133 [Glycomyces harbinensis]
MRSLELRGNRRRLLAVLTALVAMAGLSGAFAAPAQAAIGNCVQTSGAKVCFDPNGDHLYVYDTAADGMAATGFCTFGQGWFRAENNGSAGSRLDRDLTLSDSTLICYVATATEQDEIIHQSMGSDWISAGNGSRGGDCPELTW